MTTQPSHLIVVGASAGGVEALREFVAGLPEDLCAAVLVVLHLPAGGTSALAPILRRAGALPAVAAEHGMALEAGTIYTAVPDHHLLVSDGQILLSRGPTENGHRPGVDALFRSAAIGWGSRAAGVVLSGSLDDGTAGLSLIKARGGLTAVQDPDEAVYRSMPESALSFVTIDLVLPAKKIGGALAEQLRLRPALPAGEAKDMDHLEARIDAGEQHSSDEVTTMMTASGLACPDCGGGLFSVTEGVRYRCRVGHAWSGEALLLEQHLEIERSLWTALRALEEKRQLAERMSSDARRHGHERLAERYATQGTDHGHAADTLRRLLIQRKPS